jgi:hypothetical protein
VGPCHHGMARPQEERPPVMEVAANTLNKQSRTADKGWSSTWGLDEVLTTPHRKKFDVAKHLTKSRAFWLRIGTGGGFL